MNTTLDREARVPVANPLGLAGIEFIEYTTPRPQALGQVLEQLGFQLVARHRSREVTLYRQGGMHIVVNAHALPPGTADAPQIAAIALRVRDAGAAWRRAVDLGAWPVPANVQPMELHIPAVHGVGATRLYFVDRWATPAEAANGQASPAGHRFSIYDVDFVPVPQQPSQQPSLQQAVPARDGLHWFGVVQYVGEGRIADWCAFYGTLLGCEALPDQQRFGILPAGRVLRSPCGSFYLQLIEPPPAGDDEGCEQGPVEQLQRVAFGTPDVPAAVRSLRQQGVAFVEAEALHSDSRGALTEPLFGGVMFELVHHQALAPATANAG